ncbi:MmcQ/YjbR family DNA-binding protein [Flammeovirga kamogawensis]|uniref:MmcQ/YjbR family DNA-binding protein n=1 Tax=Flammeovirga kamogawensis TaxID=373891 RepID=A0ABX8GV16_9BACT|nr:MmcQ/YjbR family DNA-binding protein [Flammeovirga kamogawensis]MBB6461639.1 putative DNA-binding protein (MmcQ/YjbR family) [Flammeovirga kamogawensis]QWG07434.1 MmcQ/YjbR family DNA-binding protein [Flammeovirga kamogawensis]TRX69245.1 MmcQ/YjbR family DNA-binding protein [Flammeovirga kamogawensis]
MNIEDYRRYCLNKKGVTEGFPFDESVLVFKVKGKVFALTNIDDFQSFNVKCDPEKAIDLRERYAAVKPGFHMNKKHWNTISVYSDFSDDQMYEALDHSYDLVFSKLPKKVREELLSD